MRLFKKKQTPQEIHIKRFYDSFYNELCIKRPWIELKLVVVTNVENNQQEYRLTAISIDGKLRLMDSLHFESTNNILLEIGYEPYVKEYINLKITNLKITNLTKK